MGKDYYAYMKEHSDWENWIDSMFLQMGIPQDIKGYDYLMAAVVMATEEPELMHIMTREFYPRLADMFNTTPSRVERSIRHAIELAWSNGSPRVLTTAFGYTVGADKGKPTNGNFIAVMSNKLRRAYY